MLYAYIIAGSKQTWEGVRAAKLSNQSKRAHRGYAPSYQSPVTYSRGAALQRWLQTLIQNTQILLISFRMKNVSSLHSTESYFLGKANDVKKYFGEIVIISLSIYIPFNSLYSSTPASYSTCIQ